MGETVAEAITVLGPVPVGQLGIALTHEHLLVDLTSTMGTSTIYIQNDVELAIEEVRMFKEAGGSTLVELSNAGIGRNPLGLKRIAQETGLHLVAATGYYRERAYPREVFELGTNQLAAKMVRDITHGIDGTEVRAGIIGELGSERHFISPAEERVFRAAARAHLQTGAAISTHTFNGELALEQLDILEDEGVNLQRVVIGHLGDRRDLDCLEAVADRGAYLGIDHIGFTQFASDAQRVHLVLRLIERGYLLQILLSQDIGWRTSLHSCGGCGYDHILRVFVPMLRAAGLGQEEIDVLLIENPRQLLRLGI